MPKPITLEFNGRSQSVSAWAREIGIRVDVIMSRLRNNWPIENILTTPTGERRVNRPHIYQGGRLIEHSGRKQTVSEWAKETGLSSSVIDGRLGLGWSVSDTLTKPVHPRNPRGAGHKRKNMRAYMPPHKRPGYYPKPLDSCCEMCHQKCDDLHGDHDPLTKRFRGWLCFHCNTGLGKLGDNIEGLRRAIAYLERKLTT